MPIAEQQLRILLTLLQFIALAVPAVAMMMQVVLRFQDQHGADNIAIVGWEFRLIEASFFALVVGGVLIAHPIVTALTSGLAQIGIGLALLSLLFLVLATGVALRRPQYPTESYNSIEEAVKGTTKTVAVTVLAFVIAGSVIFGLIRFTQFAILILSFDPTSTDSAIRTMRSIIGLMPSLLFVVILYEVLYGIARFTEGGR